MSPLFAVFVIFFSFFFSFFFFLVGEWVKDTGFPQENVVKQTLVGVSATCTYDLKREEGIYNQDPYFEVSVKLMQININPEPFSPFLPFFWAQ